MTSRFFRFAILLVLLLLMFILELFGAKLRTEIDSMPAELDEVLSLSDRVVVIYEGRIVGEVDPKSVTEEEIGLMMTGGKA